MMTFTHFATSKENPVWQQFRSVGPPSKHIFSTTSTRTYIREGKKFVDDDTHELILDTVSHLQDILQYCRSPYTSEFRDSSIVLWKRIRSLGEKDFNYLAVDVIS